MALIRRLHCTYTVLPGFKLSAYLLLEQRRDEHSLQAASSALFDSFLQKSIPSMSRRFSPTVQERLAEMFRHKVVCFGVVAKHRGPR